MYKKIKRLKGGLGYIFINCFIGHFPIWNVRKALYKLLGMKIGKNSRINMGCIVMKPWKITIGDNSMINENAILDGRGGLIIGDSCSISMCSILYTASHYANSASFEWYSKPTIIGDCVWIGAGAIILPGSELMDYTIIGANSTFKGISEYNGIYIGVPAVKIRERKLSKKYKLNLSDIGYFV